MNHKKSRKQQAKILRNARKIHRIMGIFLFVFFIIIAISGSLLGWKKHSNGNLLPKTTQGTSDNVAAWLPLYELKNIANQAITDSISSGLSIRLDRIDIREKKGILKFKYQDHLNEVQLDGVTGKVLQIGVRRADLIEQIHDGSIVDDYLKLPNGIFKLVYTTIMGVALFLFSATGFWLWYGPKRLKQSSRK